MSKHISLLSSRFVTPVGVNAAGLLQRASNIVVKRSIHQSAQSVLPIPVAVDSTSSFPFHTGYCIPVAGGLCAVGGVAYWVYLQWTTPIVADSTSNIVRVVSNNEYL